MVGLGEDALGLDEFRETFCPTIARFTFVFDESVGDLENGSEPVYFAELLWFSCKVLYHLKRLIRKRQRLQRRQYLRTLLRQQA